MFRYLRDRYEPVFTSGDYGEFNPDLNLIRQHFFSMQIADSELYKKDVGQESPSEDPVLMVEGVRIFCGIVRMIPC